MTNGFADLVFTTERLQARSWRTDDVILALELWGDVRVTGMIDTRGPLSRKQVEDKLYAELDRQKQFGIQYWPIFKREFPEFVGCAGLRPWPGETQAFELGFHIVKRHWGHGYASEAAQGVLDFAAEKFPGAKIFAGHHPDNQASRRVLQKLGFKFISEQFFQPTGLMHPTYQLG